MADSWNRGDVFLVPLDDERTGLGQIVDVLPSELYVVIYEDAWSAPPPAEVVAGLTPLFASLTLDAKLYHGDWEIIGNVTDNLPAIRLPLSKVRISGKMCIENHDGSASRPATPEEAECLRFRKTVAPVRLENALKAHYKLVEQNAAYQELSYDLVVDSSTLNPA